MTVTGPEWLRRFAIELGIPEPSDAEIESLLALAGTAAHASERTAAPLSCWLVGKAGLDATAARAAADRLATELGGA
jgi:hypothetical protein